MCSEILDRIRIRDLSMRCIIGTFEEERHQKQDVVVGLTLHVSTERAGQTDDLADTVDYFVITECVTDLVENSSFFLVERLAERIAETCLSDLRVALVTVQIAKPGALAAARTVELEITRAQTGQTQPTHV